MTKRQRHSARPLLITICLFGAWYAVGVTVLLMRSGIQL